MHLRKQPKKHRGSGEALISSVKHQMIPLHYIALRVSAVMYPAHLLPSEGTPGHCLHEALLCQQPPLWLPPPCGSCRDYDICTVGQTDHAEDKQHRGPECPALQAVWDTCQGLFAVNAATVHNLCSRAILVQSCSGVDVHQFTFPAFRARLFVCWKRLV